MTTDSSTGDWTPEREREARERCERATPGPWTVAVVDHWTNDAHGERTEIRCPPDPKNVNGFDVLGWGDGPETWDAAFIAHARADLPAALAEIERLTAELAARAPAARVTGVRVATGAREELNEFAEQAWRDGLDVEAFTDIREERAPGARSAPFVPTEEQAHHSALLAALYAKGATEREVIDFLYRESEERRAALLKSAEREWPPHVVLPASRPDAPERTFPRVTLGSVAPGSLIENAGGFIALVLAQEGRKHRRLLWVDTGMIGDMHEGATVSLRATPAELDALTSADASRPGLTEEQAPTPAEMLAACTEEGFGGFGQGFVTGVLAERARLRWLPVVTENQPYIADGKTGNPTEEPCDPESCHGCANEALLRAARGETGPDEQAARVAAAAKAGWTLDPATRRWTGPSPSDPAILADVAAWEADVAAQQRVAAPTWGEQAIEEHRRAAQPEPFEKIEQLPSGLTCPGCYAATGIAQPHDPRATLHDGDPQKSGTLAGDDSGDD